MSARIRTTNLLIRSHSYDCDIVALEHPEVAGYLAAQAGGWIAEFRIPDGFDGGLTRPAVLFHNELANPNSCIIASDAVNNIHEWQPGQVYGNPLIFDRFGGTRVTIVSFDLQKKTARLRVQVKATRPPFIDPAEIFGLVQKMFAMPGVLMLALTSASSLSHVIHRAHMRRFRARVRAWNGRVRARRTAKDRVLSLRA